MIKNALIIFGVGVFLCLFIPSLYLSTAIIGALIPSASTMSEHADGTERPYKIQLLMSFLHADIAIPVDDAVVARFAFLRQANIPLDNPNLRYLVFGWGSEAFYTTAGDYTDITLPATMKAITGDQSVMHIVPSGDIEFAPNAVSVQLTQQGFKKLLAFIEKSFQPSKAGQAQLMEGVSHGYGDVFYKGVGGFNIVYPCNMWVNTALRAAGIDLGIWTPTTQSLKLSLALWNQE